jgi:aminoglycoside 3-N-acetyltransferase
MVFSYHDFIKAFNELGLQPTQPVIVHASLSQIGEIRGGPETVLGALLKSTSGILAPTFTFKTMLTPESGPENNAITYGTGRDRNKMAEYFMPDMPSDPSMGILPETIRRHPNAKRSTHPILSFSGINVDGAIQAQTIEDPYAPAGVLADEEGLVVLIGVDHTANTSIHYAEKLAGRKQFVRWALTPQGAKECPGFGGCSNGFEQAAAVLEQYTKTVKLGGAVLRSIPLIAMIMTIADLIKKQPQALLCHKMDCERCEVVRRCAPQRY